MRHILVCCALSLALLLATPVLASDDSPSRGGAFGEWVGDPLSSIWNRLFAWLDGFAKDAGTTQGEENEEGENDPPDEDPDPDFGPLTDPIG